jgi:hypothetical protein
MSYSGGSYDGGSFDDACENWGYDRRRRDASSDDEGGSGYETDSLDEDDLDQGAATGHQMDFPCNCEAERSMICEDHRFCQCDPLGFSPPMPSGLIQALNSGARLNSLLVGYNHDGQPSAMEGSYHGFYSGYCCDWYNTCRLSYVDYDAWTGVYSLKDNQGHIFTYDSSYILAYSLKLEDYLEPEPEPECVAILKKSMPQALLFTL